MAMQHTQSTSSLFSLFSLQRFECAAQIQTNYAVPPHPIAAFRGVVVAQCISCHLLVQTSFQRLGVGRSCSFDKGMASGSPAGLDRQAAWELFNGELILFGITRAKALQRCSNCSEYLDVGELFSGVGHIVKAARQHGYVAQGFDLKRSPGETDSRTGPASEDITCEIGFNNALDLVLRAQGM